MIADADLLPAATYRGRGLRQLLSRHVELGAGQRRRQGADRHHERAGRRRLHRCGRLRAGATAAVLGQWVAASSTAGTFLRSFGWGNARQLDAVGRRPAATRR
ncbi:MAG: hypothetical protein ABIY36_02330 [Candidatus Limnocylindria bacterium]